MKDIKIKDIIKICDVKDYFGNLEDECINFSKDTRTIEKNDVYVGIKGGNFDGNIFFDKAFELGASTCIIQDLEITQDIKEKYNGKNLIIVEDTMKAIAQIAKFKLSLYNIPIVAITGSVGKTSTKDIIASVVSQKYKTLKTIGNNNNEIGMPFTIFRLKDEEAIVLEMGMNNKGEIERLSNIANPHIAVITNVGTSNIGNLGSRENILAAKMEITSGMNEKGILILNNDNDMLATADFSNKITYGIESDSNLKAENIYITDTGSTFDVKIGEETYKIEVPVPGEHFIYNSLSAIAVGLKLNIEMALIIKGIKEFELTKGRMEVINSKNKYLIINDAYNASFDSMKSGIEYLKRINGSKKIAVLGDMLELGEFAEELHKKVGKIVADNELDILIVCGENSKYIAEEAEKNGMNSEKIFKCINAEEIVLKIKEIVKERDVVYFKASNAMNFGKIISEIK